MSLPTHTRSVASPLKAAAILVLVAAGLAAATLLLVPGVRTHPVAVAALVGAGLVLAIALWALVDKVRSGGDRRAFLREPLEISTLTFPPGSLARNSRR